MEITKEMLIAEFKRQIDFAKFVDSKQTSPFRAEFLEYALKIIQELTKENARLKKSYQIAVQDNADTCELLFKAEDEVKELKCQVERMRDSLRYEDSLLTSIITTARIGVALEMANRLKTEATTIQDHTGKLGSVVLVGAIDRIAQEMIGETK